MDDVTRYKNELDLIFQEIEEKEQLQRQAESLPYDDFIVNLCRYKSIQELLHAVPVENRIKIIEACWQAKLAHDKSQRM